MLSESRIIHNDMKTYSCVAVELHAFLTWLQMELIGQLSVSASITIGLKSECVSLPVCVFEERKGVLLCLESNSN